MAPITLYCGKQKYLEVLLLSRIKKTKSKAQREPPAHSPHMIWKAPFLSLQTSPTHNLKTNGRHQKAQFLFLPEVAIDPSTCLKVLDFDLTREQIQLGVDTVITPHLQHI